MSASWRWLVAGLVAAAMLVGLGWWIGHRSVTSSEAERAAWQSRTDSLLGVERDRYRALVASLRDSVVVDTSEAARLRRVAERADSGARRWRAEADTLTALLVVAGTVRDSLRLYQRGVTVRDSIVARETARADTLAAALEVSMQATARLLTVARADSIRINALESQLRSAPKPPRWELRAWGLRVRPGAFVGLGLGGGATAGVGLVVTP